MGNEAKAPIELLHSVLTALLSWIVLAAVSIIISGKLVTLRLPMGINDDASFNIPLVLFKIQAKGEEVTSGFLAFILSLAVCIFAGGKDAYLLFREQSGVDIGQWNSLCVMASFLCLIISAFICVIVPFFRGNPVVSQQDRSETLRILERTDGQ